MVKGYLLKVDGRDVLANSAFSQHCSVPSLKPGIYMQQKNVHVLVGCDRIQFLSHPSIHLPIHPNLSLTKCQKLLGDKYGLDGPHRSHIYWSISPSLLSLPTVGSGVQPPVGDPMQADGPRGCRFAGQWFPESQSWHPSVPPFGEMSCITCRCGVSGGLCEVGIGDLAWGRGTS